MRKLLLLALAALSPSCGGTSVYTFTGANVDYNVTFRLEGHKDKGLLLVLLADHGVGLGLPYAEDWVFEPTEAKPVSGKSSSLMMFVTLQKHRPDRKVEEEAFLKDEYLKNLRAAAERRGSQFYDTAVTKQGDHFVLEYANEGTLPNGAQFVQTHFWTFRQRDDGMIYEAHLSTVQQDPTERGKACAARRGRRLDRGGRDGLQGMGLRGRLERSTPRAMRDARFFSAGSNA